MYSPQPINLHMIDSPRNIFDPQLKQHKFVEENWGRKQESCEHEAKRAKFVPKEKCSYKEYSAVKFSMFSPIFMESALCLLTCL